MCADRATMQRISDFMAYNPKPTNTEPGIADMLAAGTDWSATDAFARSGTPVEEPPHWRIMWPFDPTSTGLPTTLRQAGTWIMYAGTLGPPDDPSTSLKLEGRRLLP